FQSTFLFSQEKQPDALVEGSTSLCDLSV
ncbi:hypothetical protein, partial [Salmonella enterica]